MKSPIAIVFAATMMMSSLSHAYLVEVLNASFESPAPDGWKTINGVAGTTNGQWTDGDGNDVSKWDENGISGTWRPGEAMFSSIPDGQQVAYVNPVNGVGSRIWQTTTETLKAGYTYTLRVMVGTRDNAPLDGADAFFDGAKIRLLAGDSGGYTQLASAQILPTDLTAPAQGGWVPLELVFNVANDNPLIGKLLRIRIDGLALGTQTNFDDVTLTAVPLPAAALLLGSALFGLGAARRFRRSPATAFAA